MKDKLKASEKRYDGLPWKGPVNEFFVNTGLLYSNSYLKMPAIKYSCLVFAFISMYRYIDFTYTEKNSLTTFYESILKLFIFFNPEVAILYDKDVILLGLTIGIMLLNVLLMASFISITSYVTHKEMINEVLNQKHRFIIKTCNIISGFWYFMNVLFYQYSTILLTSFFKSSAWISKLEANYSEVIMIVFKISLFFNIAVVLLVIVADYQFNEIGIKASNMVSHNSRLCYFLLNGFKYFVSIYVVIRPDYAQEYVLIVIATVVCFLSLVACLLERSIYDFKLNLFCARFIAILFVLAFFNLLKMLVMVQNEIVLFILMSTVICWSLKSIFIKIFVFKTNRIFARIKKTGEPILKRKLYFEYLEEMLWFYKNMESEPMLLESLKQFFIGHIFNCEVSTCVCKTNSHLINKETVRQYIISIYTHTFHDHQIDMDYNSMVFHLKYSVWVARNYIYAISLIQNNKYKNYSLNQHFNILVCYYYFSSLWQKDDLPHIQTSEIDVSLIVNMCLAVEDMYKEILDCVQTHKEVWKILNEPERSVHKVELLLDLKFQQEDSIHKMFNMIIRDYRNDYRLLFIYSVFCSSVIFDIRKFRKLLNQLEKFRMELEYNLGSPLQIFAKFGHKNDNLVLVASGAEKTIGIIKDVYYNYYDFLGYEKDDIINKSVNVLIPQCIATHHDTIMTSYFKHGRAKLLNNIVPVYMLHKKGYVVTGEVYLKTSLNYSFGIDFVLFFSPGIDSIFQEKKRLASMKEKVHYILFDDKSKIWNLSKDFDLHFGLPKTFYKMLVEVDRKDKTFYVEDLFPEFESNVAKYKSFKLGTETNLAMNRSFIKNEMDLEISGNSGGVEVCGQVFFSGSVFNGTFKLYYAYIYNQNDLVDDAQLATSCIMESNKFNLSVNHTHIDAQEDLHREEDVQIDVSGRIAQLKDIYIKTSVRKFGCVFNFLLYAFVIVMATAYILCLVINSHYNKTYFKAIPRVFGSMIKNEFNLYNSMFNLNNLFYGYKINANTDYINTSGALKDVYEGYQYIKSNVTITNDLFYSDIFTHSKEIVDAGNFIRIYYYNETSEYSYSSSYTTTLNILNSYLFYISQVDDELFNNTASTDYQKTLTFSNTVWGTATNNLLLGNRVFFKAISSLLVGNSRMNYVWEMAIAVAELPFLIVLVLVLILLLLKLPKKYYNDIGLLFKYNPLNYEKYINQCFNIEKLVDYVKKYRLAKVDIHSNIDDKENQAFHANIENTMLGQSIFKRSTNRLLVKRNTISASPIKYKMKITLQCAIITTFAILIVLAFVPKVILSLKDYSKKKESFSTLISLLEYENVISQAYYGFHHFSFNPRHNITAEHLGTILANAQTKIQEFSLIVQKHKDTTTGAYNFGSAITVLNNNICDFYNLVMNTNPAVCSDENTKIIYNKGESFISLYMFDEINKQMNSQSSYDSSKSYLYSTDIIRVTMTALNYCIEMLIDDINNLFWILEVTNISIYSVMICLTIIVMLSFGRISSKKLKALSRNHLKLINFLNEDEIEKSQELKAAITVNSRKF